MARCGSPNDVERQGANWPKAAEGIQLAGFAIFLLLNTTGVLPWSFWLDAIALWPLLIMSAGIKIAFEKSRARWLVLLGPVIILGGLAWLASGHRPEAPTGPWEAENVSRPEGTQRVELEAGLAGARLRLAAADDLPADHLVEGRSQGRQDSARLEVHADGGTAEVRLGGGKKHNVVFLPRPREHWDLRLPTRLPLRVRIKGAGVGGDLDLTAAPLEGLATEGVFIGVDARLPAPSKDTEIRMNGVFNSLSLSVPEGTPVRVHGAGLPFNAVDRGVHGIQGRPGYDVSVHGVFSAVEVRTDPAISREPPPVDRPADASAETPHAASPSPSSPPSPSRPPAEAPPSGRIG
jgi:hypothetical protein